MINIVYCPYCPEKTIIAAGNNIGNGTHIHNSSAMTCVCKYNIDEPNYQGEIDFMTKDGTKITNSKSWFQYLSKYVI